MPIWMLHFHSNDDVHVCAACLKFFHHKKKIFNKTFQIAIRNLKALKVVILLFKSWCLILFKRWKSHVYYYLTGSGKLSSWDLLGEHNIWSFWLWWTDWRVNTWTLTYTQHQFEWIETCGRSTICIWTRKMCSFSRADCSWTRSSQFWGISYTFPWPENNNSGSDLVK